MLLEASEEGVDGNWDGGRIVWSVRYAFEGEDDNGSQLNGMDQLQQRLQQRQMQHHHHHHAERRKLQARLEIQKDDIQAVLPISKVSRKIYMPETLILLARYPRSPYGEYFTLTPRKVGKAERASGRFLDRYLLSSARRPKHLELGAR